MGSDQSSQQKQVKKAPPMQRGHTLATDGEQSGSANNSPGTSVCSDSELPYISYTQGRPIGDSPKHKQSTHKKTSPRVVPKAKRPSDVVVVREAKSAPDLTDEAMKKLHNIPTFLPIIHSSSGFTNVEDPAILEGLDYKPFYQLASRYQAHLAACAQPLATEQHALATKVKELENELGRLFALMVEKQRQNARNSERLSRIHEIKFHVSSCRSLLRENIINAQDLNMLLPEEHRLEPFVWNTTICTL